jgi:threonine dehydratase
VNLGETVIDVTFETRGPEQVNQLLAALSANNYKHELVR